MLNVRGAHDERTGLGSVCGRSGRPAGRCFPCCVLVMVPVLLMSWQTFRFDAHVLAVFSAYFTYERGGEVTIF